MGIGWKKREVISQISNPEHIESDSRTLKLKMMLFQSGRLFEKRHSDRGYHPLTLQLWMSFIGVKNPEKSSFLKKHDYNNSALNLL